MSPRVFLVAGEPSGDRLGAALMAGLATETGGAVRFEGVGGPDMAAAGLTSLFPMDELTLMGLAEILPAIPRILRRLDQTARAVAAARPDALITIDSPDFCLRLAARVRARAPGIPVIHYVAPSVWAWRPGRAARMAAHVDHVLCLLPFEPDYMARAGMGADFVGHPIATEPVATAADVAALRAALGIAPGRPALVVLPGSRRSEVTRLAPVFAETVTGLRARLPDVAVIVPAAAAVRAETAAALPPGAILLDPADPEAQARKRAAFRLADAALAASGTVSLELAAQGCPMVIGYKTNWLTGLVVRQLVQVDTVTLVNLVTGTRTVPEFLLGDCRADRILPALAGLIGDPARRAEQRAAADQAMARLGRGGPPPGLRAARAVLAVLEGRARPRAPA